MSNLLELPGKVVDRCVAKAVGYLGKVQLIAADQFFGSVDLHQGEKFHDPAAVKFLEQFLEAGAADQRVFADDLDSQLFVDVFFHVADDSVVSLVGTSQTGAYRRVGGDRQRVGKIAAVQVDKKLFQVIADKLLGPETGG